MKELKVRLTFTEEILGTASNDKEIHAEFIASKAPDAPNRNEKIAEEIDAVGLDETIEKGKTVFPKDEDGKPFLYDYQIKGFFKNSQKAINYMTKDKAKGYLPSYKSKIDNLVFVSERRVYFQTPDDTEIGNCQRPLRGQTAQGERIALANSETMPAGTQIEFTIVLYENAITKNAKMWLNYGNRNGIGQWHNSGKGRFTWELLDEKDAEIDL